MVALNFTLLLDFCYMGLIFFMIPITLISDPGSFEVTVLILVILERLSSNSMFCLFIIVEFLSKVICS